MKIKWHFFIIAFIYFLLIFTGACLYHKIEGWNYLDSTYFLVITATTIGYGDLTPQTDIGKIITIFYSFIGIAVVFYLISLIGNFMFKKHLKEKVEEIKKDIKKTKDFGKNKH